jgi:hypothetical protein
MMPRPSCGEAVLESDGVSLGPGLLNHHLHLLGGEHRHGLGLDLGLGLGPSISPPCIGHPSPMITAAFSFCCRLID